MEFYVSRKQTIWFLCFCIIHFIQKYYIFYFYFLFLVKCIKIHFSDQNIDNFRFRKTQNSSSYRTVPSNSVYIVLCKQAHIHIYVYMYVLCMSLFPFYILAHSILSEYLLPSHLLQQHWHASTYFHVCNCTGKIESKHRNNNSTCKMRRGKQKTENGKGKHLKIGNWNLFFFYCCCLPSGNNRMQHGACKEVKKKNKLIS